MARNSIAPGGYIGGEPPRRPMFNQLSGVWKLDDAMERQRAGTWANPLGIEDLFSTYLYTGNDSTQTITNGIDLSGKGGLVWTKGRGAFSENHAFVDTARGTNKYLASNTTDAEGTGTQLTAFNNNGYTLGSVNGWEGNGSGRTYASWTFRKAVKFFDVVTYTGNGASSRYINHSLESVPGCIIVKRTDSSEAGDWSVYHRSLGNNAFIYLNSTGAATTGSDRWNFTTPTSTQFRINSDWAVNKSSATYVAYLFAHDAGGFGDSGNESIIKCGSYTGNGTTTGPVINLGWEPQWLLIKRTDGGTTSWIIHDNMRGIFVDSDSPSLIPNSSTPESTETSIRVLPTGFQPKTISAAYNGDGATYIYIAIRRGPMKAPTDATKVFADNRATPSTGNSFTTNFPVDLSIANAASNGIIGYFQDRLRGYPTSSNTVGNYPLLVSTSANAESAYNNSSPYMWGVDSNTGVKYGGNLGGLLNTTYAFRRAPGFFDVVAYTGTGSTQSISHNLSVVPEMIIIKSRSSGSTFWMVYHHALGKNGAFPNHITLNEGNTKYSGTSGGFAADPTNSVFTVGAISSWGGSGQTYIAYLFASCPGVSKVGSYTGTGTTLNIDCGFSNGARFVVIKRTDNTGDWYVWDTARGIIAANDPYLLLNSTAAEVTNTDYIDPLNSGFQISSTAPAAINANGGSFIFFAVA